jgi:hypothetical protein
MVQCAVAGERRQNIAANLTGVWRGGIERRRNIQGHCQGDLLLAPIDVLKAQDAIKTLERVMTQKPTAMRSLGRQGQRSGSVRA